MNIINKINYSGKKLIKGFFAIFTFKLLLLGGAFVVQSCQNDENIFVESKQELALKDFKSIAKSNIPNTNKSIENLIISKERLKSIYFKTDSDKVYNNFDYNSIEEIESQTELQAEIGLTPLINSSKSLLETYGITENELRDLFEDIGIFNINDPSLAIIGMTIAFCEEQDDNISINYNNLFSQPIYAQSSTYDCVLRSVGIDAVIELINGRALGGKLAKDLLKKAIRKVAMRTLGWVGAAIAVFEFGRCMDWWFSGNAGNNTLNINDCNDLVRVTTKNYNYLVPFVYLSKESINYISDTEYYINSVKAYDIYSIEFEGEIGSNCLITKTGGNITSQYFDSSSIEGYVPLENEEEVGR
ncbi:MAG: hypothetical protein ABJK28_05455 [Algibacter sp.]